ncbi:MAG: chromosome segregation protein SMC [Lachnospiraceae bacterium]|nr:chromosome segregation protein SMC [Lachnospiraceae bacterium]
MYLKRIELSGFKSFANKTVLDFAPGITVIVGPNGSGKSNVSDAVRWVLGEQSAKSLRGAKMEDVIFAGTQLRKPVSFASVSLYLDNTDRMLDRDDDEVSVTRRVYRSGESDYLLNGVGCRLKDIQELFYDTGIGKDGYSIIGQGQVEKILSGKPEERREIFDDAAGIMKFKKRKAQSEKNLEENKQNLARVYDILTEIESQIKPLEKQSEVAKVYLKLKEELRKYEINFFISENEKQERIKSELTLKIENANNEFSIVKDNIEETRKEYELIDKDLSEIDAKIEKNRDADKELVLKIANNESEIKLLEQSIENVHRMYEHYNNRKNTIDDEISEKQKECDDILKKKEKLLAKRDATEKEVQAAESELDEIYNRIEEYENSISESNNEIRSIEMRSQSFGAKKEASESILNKNSLDIAEFTKKMIAVETRIQGVNKNIDDNEKGLETISLQIDNLNDVLNDNEASVVSLRDDIQRKSEERVNLNNEKIALHSKIESLKNIAERYDGFSNATRKIMENKNHFSGVCGVVSDLITTEKNYETAIETALGNSLQNIVTDDNQTAKQLIEFLKKNSFGRATFLPLTDLRIRDNKDEMSCLREKGAIDTAANLVKADKKYKGLVDYLLLRTYVFDNYDNAVAAAKKYNFSLRIVTLEGELLMPNGAVQGGSYKNNSSLLGRKREITEGEEKLISFDKQITKITSEINSLQLKREEIKNKVQNEREKLNALEIKKNSVLLAIENLGREKNELVITRDEIKDSVSILETQNKNIINGLEEEENEIKEGQAKLDKIKDDIQYFKNRLSNEHVREKKNGEKTAQIRIELAGIDNSIEFALENMTRIKNEIERIMAEYKTIQEEADKEDEKVEALEKQIKDYGFDNVSARKKLDDLSSEHKMLQAKKNELTSKNKGCIEFREQLIEREASLDKEILKLNSNLERTNEAIDSQMNYIWNEYEMTLSNCMKYRDEETMMMSYAVLKKNTQDLKSQIKALGDVNVNAIEAYKTLNERYTFLSTQKKDIEEAAEALIKGIAELDEEMRNRFATKFEEIRKEFDVVFKELFGGGQGTIELVDDEDILLAGIKITAQPPGKKLQNMMQLSGGEKALTAIALLFAIQNLKPSPFCLLDEIEAALDDSNVNRYADYLRKLSGNTQFITITHRRGTMTAADILYGITMQEKGVSTLVSVSLIDKELKN